MADEGKNQVARNLLDLEPTAVLEFYKLQLDPIAAPEGFPQEIPFHAGTIFQGNVTWQGVKYIPLAVETEGFEMLGDRRLPRPRIRIANNNQLITFLLQTNKDLINAKVVRKKAFLKNLDDINFDGGNPWGQANANAEIVDEVWVIGRKTHESKVMVEFELNSPLDLESFSVNSRSIVSKFCGWQYRGEGCRYRGIPIEREDGKSFLDPTGGVVIPTFAELATKVQNFYTDPDYVWDSQTTYGRGSVVTVPNKRILVTPYASDNPGTDPREAVKTCYVCVTENAGKRPEGNPTYWQKDGCTKQLTACRKRFSNTVTYVLDEVLDEDSFNAIEFKGNTNLTSDDAQTAGAFYSLETTGTQKDLTGILTGTFTIAGWVKDNNASSALSAIWSTTPQGLQIGATEGAASEWASGDMVKFINLARETPYVDVGEEDNWFSDVGDDPVVAGLYYYVSEGSDEKNPIDGSDAINNVESRFTPADGVTDSWKFYVITNQGPETPIRVAVPAQESLRTTYIEDDPTQLQMWINPTEQDSPEILGQGGPSDSEFASLTSRKAPHGNFAGLPEQFMLGSIISGSVHPTMNGKLGPWALWDRQLTPAERVYLYKAFMNPEDTNEFAYIPRDYSECTGDFEDITGSNLIAWWDMSTALIPTTTNTGLVDVHSGLYWLTGSGYFYPTTETNRYANTEVKNNWSSLYPRYGGFPGTDGFGFRG
jgi:lambda family phage minor tail protein L